MLRIAFANRFETLRDLLMQALAMAPASPFAPEQVIVPSSAVRRDLSLAMARQFGICANVEFSFLAQWLWAQIGKVLPEVEAESPFSAPVLAWRISRLLEDRALVAAHPRLSNYLEHADPVARFEFANKVATLFEQYMTYRPEWLAAWSAGQPVENAHDTGSTRADQAWQAAIWRAISHQLGLEREHPATKFLRTVAAMGEASPGRLGLPETAHVFCLPSIPPLYLDLLRQLGRWVEIHVYVLNPCREYWFEVVDRRRLSYLASRGEAAYHESGNRLLSAWGRQTQSQIDLLLENAGVEAVETGHFEPAAPGTILAGVQNAILDLVDIGPASFSPDPGDRSVEVHVCHSLTRELEVLHDQLLALFAGANPPSPSDILVVTPDLEDAAPLIEAVFGNAPPDRHIPYAITGRARSTVNAPARALLSLLALATSRFTASAVFDLLEQAIVARRYGLSAADLETIQGWIRVAGIRWGIDGRHREQHGLPGLDRFTFDDGLQRLFLGYALPERSPAVWLDRLPAGNAEGAEASVLGVFARYVADLVRLRSTVGQALGPDAWMKRLLEVLDTFLAPDGTDVDDLGEVRDAIRELCHNMVRAGVVGQVGLAVVRKALTDLLDDPARGGVPTGTVTFSSISSLRNVPAKVLCVIGLNDGVFPSASRPAEFDLIALFPRRGDRQRRIDERNLFLDLLLSARERLYLSYTGRSVRDNAPMPGSVLLAELVDVLVEAMAVDPASATARDEARRRLVVEHPLQPFSLRYFSADPERRLRSFNRELCEALKAGLTAAPGNLEIRPDEPEDGLDEAVLESGRPFFGSPLAPPEATWRTVSLAQLMRFFRNPCQFLLRERMGIELVGPGDELVDDEPFLPDYAGRQALAERLLPHLYAGVGQNALRHLALAGVEYPPGRLGEGLLDRELRALNAFAEAHKHFTAEASLPPWDATLAFRLDGEDWHLTGAFADLRPSGLVRQRYDDTRATDYLSGWLSHLFLCAARPEGVALETRWLSRDGEYRLWPCPEAHEILHALVLLYREGLSAPLHFFPKSAWAYIRHGESRYMAATTWQSSQNSDWSEAGHPAYRLALRGVGTPLDEAFYANAGTVFGRMLDYLEDARL